MGQQLTLFATCPRGVEDLLADECRQQGLVDISPALGGVHCRGDLTKAYSLCLNSRVASRILSKLQTFPVACYDDLYRGVQALDWNTHLNRDGSFAVDAHTSHAELNNSHYATLKIKDAVVDQFKQNFGSRPDVKRERPDVRINAYIDRQACTLYLDLSGEALHRRGYRQQTGAAPLKENLAAAILLRARWPELAGEHRPLIDPLCGSATLLIEAASIAASRAPGLLRGYYGFFGWKQHQAEIWEQVRAEAVARTDITRVPRLVGIEKSFKVAGIARENVKAAGFGELIEIIQADSVAAISLPAEPTGLIVTNPPYGVRIGENKQLKRLYLDLGNNLKSAYPGWRVALFTASHELARFFGLRAHHKNTLYNGALKCTLYQYQIRDNRIATTKKPENHGAKTAGKDAGMLANRLEKNIRHLTKWARREGISCYRIYDADLPQYAVAIDIYEDWVHIQEYEPPASVDPVKAFLRLDEAVAVVSNLLDVDSSKIVVKTRKKQSGRNQYMRQGDAGESVIAHEAGFSFQVNIKDYLDTGLFLDHRLTRKLIAGLSHGQSFLNLFAYTGTATVYAAAGGARTSTTVDMSNTYLAWAQRNMKLNHLMAGKHRFIRDDCIKWLHDAEQAKQRYQLIFLDPPTFSNSKRMDHTLDIRRDHVDLIRQVMAILDDRGLLIFSTNARGFKLDEQQLDAFAIRDITRMTTTEDFRRKPAHKCWCLAKQAERLKDCRL